MFATRTAWPRPPSPWSAIAARARVRPGLLDLTVSNPTGCGFEYEGRRILDALARPEALRYDPQPLGLGGARESVAAYYRGRGVEFDPERIVLTASTSEAYSHLFRLLCDPGDEVLAPAPSYPLFDLLAGLGDVRLRDYPSWYDHGWHLDWSALEAALSSRTRALIVVHPNNPTGAYCGRADWDRLQTLARDRGLAVIVDEVFFDYPGEAAAVPLDYGAAPALTFVLNGLSKLAALPQMKLGWIAVAGPATLRSEALARLEIVNDTFLSADAPIQHAAAALLATGPAIQAQIRARTAANLAALDAARALRPALERLGPQAGWSAILRLPHLCSDEAWSELLAANGVLVHPGHFYALEAEAHIVVSLLPPPETFQTGIARVLEAVSGAMAHAG